MAAVLAYGNVRLQRGNGASPNVFATVAGVKSIDGPNIEVAFIETTDFDSAGGAREYLAGLKDVGSLNMTLNFDPASVGHQALCDDQASRTSRVFKLRMLDAATDIIWSFTAFVANVSPKMEVDGVIEAQVSLRITGDINYDAT